MNELQIIEQNGARVLTTAQLAEAYGTTTKIISQNYSRNRNRYTSGKHFIELNEEELRQFKKAYPQFEDSLKFTSVLYLWTEKGAWLHAKSLNTDEAWDAYEMLVDDYYNIQQQVKVLTEREQLIASMKLSLETAEEITFVKSEVKEIRGMVENQITLDHGEQRKIQRGIAAKVYELCSDSEERSNLFRELHREIKDRFGVSSYKDIKRKDTQAATRYIEAWIPRKVTV
ncbi:ORF6C domain-containing protein [Bacillus sp. DTU_2020_1000418_1_SI_GHA_SEK_038]|uniref:ORF6N domain-containing protein n=1 Tax=Bacillus sp. DTU_2020_1000418_1_SI_GHA_SEK_038 TaxID=3077585 RepID=UPI0028EB5BA7|nr:ORF6N domain-containing protein [Bacillus sp. DTU_2020_1000418_1_SI_GHA_SEK_038]WNS74279.1 ORF6C domain-containing protein [Bacillus sp. DTU_2020_1000418_1_SI_GHA_SEK_038]